MNSKTKDIIGFAEILGVVGQFIHPLVLPRKPIKNNL